MSRNNAFNLGTKEHEPLYRHHGLRGNAYGVTAGYRFYGLTKLNDTPHETAKEIVMLRERCDAVL